MFGFYVGAVSALIGMYQGLNSPGQLTQWSSTGGDPCGQNWKGVTCSGSRVTEMYLLHNHLLFIVN